MYNIQDNLQNTRDPQRTWRAFNL